jgi:hypothetical protein
VVFGLIIAVMLIAGGVELSPGPQMEEKLTDCMVEQKKEMKHIGECLEKDTSSSDTVSVTMDLMNERSKILMEDQERIKRLLNSCEAKLRARKKNTTSWLAWRWRNSLNIRNAMSSRIIL